MTTNCRHMVIDAGHISVASDLVSKGAVQEVRMKRKQPYNAEDFRRLESLMYDKFTLKLEDAQVSANVVSRSRSDDSLYRSRLSLAMTLNLV